METAKDKWGINVESLPDFWVDPEKLSIIQDLMFSGINVMLTGDPGTGKTELTKRLAQAHGLPFHRVNVGAIRTPRDWFGHWEFIGGQTVFIQSEFVDAIQRPGIVALDEFNRVTPDIHNSIYTILDHNREVFIEETKQYITVHPRCIFIATENRGRSHTGTFMEDTAVEDRFETIQLELPPVEVMAGLLEEVYGASRDQALLLARITHKLNSLYHEESLSRPTGFRPAISATALIKRGQPLKTALKYTFVNRFSPEGGVDSEQTTVLQVIQAYLK
ncbi:ATPase associated with various cellular activities AAA_5 [Desulfotomaculum nigrificans CO-1-SRB]|uniref:ATPase associated with various cellular activities AAA_5 n=1 Tax=Desulfotomaculum nigrificans (strain DSM 14880 / VKM B-2319 / CO-1-SRB) TaxID=868595 RepID=F6B9T3_DESCC|nr:AAA family ATPase [Desulfotomaculum nigrificans]AEF93781.1 ATPase associated with various cellular activities AAA_5 [Desulfotomaculum nigrificans CO-1-SRB]